MKVIKAEDVMEQPQTTEQTTEQGPKKADPKTIAALQEKFDSLRQVIDTKKYNVILTKEQTTFLFDEFYNNVAWKGYECYAISETHKQLQSLVKNGTLNGGTQVEIVEALFHFLKNYEGKGQKFAGVFKEVCDQFSLPMQEINQDRQDLRDASLELTAAEQGISVENLVEAYNKAQQQQQGQY